jgi:uncharacterized protein (DUF1501 family)
MMKRRSFLQLMAGAGLTSTLPSLMLPAHQAHAADPLAEITPYSGDFYVLIDAEGGWDVTSFCDPKQNADINKWALTDTTKTISGSPIQYAPFAHNERFFAQHHNDMLVGNGIDAQTNAHQAGRRHNWSGRLAEGYPSFAALVAAIKAPELPLAYISNGSYNQTADLLTYTLMQDPSALNKLVYQDQFLDFDPETDDLARFYHRKNTRDIIAQYQQQRLDRLQAQTSLASRLEKSISQFASAKNGQPLLDRLAANIPTAVVDNFESDGEWNPLLRQAQIALAAYKSGLCVSCDLVSWGFDTHANHDVDQGTAMRRLQNGIEFLWAEAERQGIAHKLKVLVSSDFGRTPEYNDGQGKDHWPIGSAVVMQKNASWANRVIGSTSADHAALAIDPLSFQANAGGIVLQPKDIQQSMRKLAGIDQHPLSLQFPLGAEDMDFFS